MSAVQRSRTLVCVGLRRHEVKQFKSEVVFHPQHPFIAMVVAIEGLLVARRHEEGHLLVGLVIDAQIGFPPTPTDVGFERHSAIR